jgi:hypothetical protein
VRTPSATRAPALPPRAHACELVKEQLDKVVAEDGAHCLVAAGWRRALEHLLDALLEALVQLLVVQPQLGGAGGTGAARGEVKRSGGRALGARCGCLGRAERSQLVGAAAQGQQRVGRRAGGQLLLQLGKVLLVLLLYRASAGCGHQAFQARQG